MFDTVEATSQSVKISYMFLLRAPAWADAQIRKDPVGAGQLLDALLLPWLPPAKELSVTPLTMTTLMPASAILNTPCYPGEAAQRPQPLAPAPSGRAPARPVSVGTGLFAISSLRELSTTLAGTKEASRDRCKHKPSLATEFQCYWCEAGWRLGSFVVSPKSLSVFCCLFVWPTSSREDQD